MEIIKYLQAFANPALDIAFTCITMMGEEFFFALTFLVFFWCIDKSFAYRLGFAFMSNGVLNTWIKEIFRFSRPIGEPGIRSLRVETATGFSFPSGHTQSTAALWTSAAFRYKHVPVYILAAVFIILVGISRLYLGVHYPRDVIFGALLGIVWVVASNRLLDLVEAGRKSVLLAFLIPALVLPFIFPTPTGAKAAGTFAGFITGYLIESEYIRFETKSTLWQHAAKLILGLGVLLLIKAGVKAILPRMLAFDFIRYMLMGVWVIAGAPFIFKRFLSRH